MNDKITDEWPEPPSVEMCVALLYELDVKLDEIIKELRAMRKEWKK
jgi:hypothetical protein